MLRLVVPTVLRVADGWEEQSRDMAAAAGQVAAAPTGGFTPAVAGSAADFTVAWQRHADGLAHRADRFAASLRAAVADYRATDEAAGRRSLDLQAWMWAGAQP